jgi:SAM-dependent methyltransferase
MAPAVPAARGFSFGANAAQYHRYRPPLPAEILENAIPPGCRSLLDLGAGTGLATRAFAERVPEVIAVDADPRMLKLLRAYCPGVTSHVGSAERIPLESASVDAVTVINAWHWFDAATAIPEIGRVLRPQGRFSAAWMDRDTTVGWMDGLVKLTERDRPQERQPGAFALPHGAAFTPPQRIEVRWTSTIPRDDLVPLLDTYSAMLHRSPTEHDRIVARVRSYIDDQPELRGDQVTVPWVSVLWHCTRTG